MGIGKEEQKNPDLTEGEEVYVKEMEKSNKLSLNFNPTPHIIERIKNGDVVVRNEDTGKKYRRNVVHLTRMEGEWKAVQDEIKNDNMEKNEGDQEV